MILFKFKFWWGAEFIFVLSFIFLLFSKKILFLIFLLSFSHKFIEPKLKLLEGLFKGIKGIIILLLGIIVFGFPFLALNKLILSLLNSSVLVELINFLFESYVVEGVSIFLSINFLSCIFSIGLLYL